jgi:NOL1/NOP2/sun family putative RNA methylase
LQQTYILQLPPLFIQSIENCPGFDKNSFEQVHASGEQITSVRINPAKKSNRQLTASNELMVPWSLNGYYLKERPSFTLDPLFHAGAYYVQEASSMFLEQVLEQTVDVAQPLKVLDLCAAPGGKSTLIQSVISSNSLLVSNEVIKTRVTILSENITKWGADNVIVTNNDAKDFQRLSGFFDVIVVDAPCSGSGLFRKDPEAVSEWSLQNVTLCSQRQQRILADVLPALKDDGILIYSTCSYSEEEDEAIADWLIDELKVESVRIKLDEGWGIVETQSKVHKACGYRFYPGKVKGEGFFIAAFKKNQHQQETKLSKQKAKAEKLTVSETTAIKSFVKNTNHLFYFKQNEAIIAMPAMLESALAAVQNALYIKKAGVKLGLVIRDELIPDHELAVSNIINDDVPFIAVDEFTALQYLRKKDISIDTTLKGWVLIKYKELPLGWVKILPNRINNYYPKEWRILNK